MGDKTQLPVMSDLFHYLFMCFFWFVSFFLKKGFWITDGCDTNRTASEFVCTCNHLSFFAVLVVNIFKGKKKYLKRLGKAQETGDAIPLLIIVVVLFVVQCH